MLIENGGREEQIIWQILNNPGDMVKTRNAAT